jgi:hypothetical protein
MIMDPTVLVLGAGASKPYGYPSGRGLYFTILNNLNFIIDPDFQSRLKNLGVTSAQIDGFRKGLAYADSPSVDAFIEYRSAFLEIGKLAMALCLLPCEDEARLFNLGWKEDIPSSWYMYLMDKLVAVDLGEFKHNKLSIVTFNYDRSLEHYLFTALMHHYGRTDRECAEALSSIPILQVYGSLGPLPCQEGEAPRPYQFTNSLQDVGSAAKQIIVMSEKQEGTPIFFRANELIRDAKKVFFLGFGYHNTNLRRLKLGQFASKNNMFGTSFGLGQADWRSISDTWHIAFKEDNIDIMGLFHNHIPP